jgi:hypothetical protein
MDTREKWAERVAAWRASGETAPAFCEGKDYAPSTLRFWASRLGSLQRREATPDIRIARVTRAPAVAEVDSPIVVELGRARVGVRRGFDPDVLRAVIEVLDGREVSR